MKVAPSMLAVSVSLTPAVIRWPAAALPTSVPRVVLLGSGQGLAHGIPEAAEADWSTLQGAASILRMHAARCEAYCDQIDKQIRALGAASNGIDREWLSAHPGQKKKNFRRRIDDR